MPYAIALTYNLKPAPSPGSRPEAVSDDGPFGPKPGDGAAVPMAERRLVPPMGIAVPVLDGSPDDAYSEFDSTQTVQAIAGVLRAQGHQVWLVEATPDMLTWFRAHRVDLVFNIAEGVSGEARESRVPAILDFLGIPYTGSGVLSLALALDKAKAKHLFRIAGIPTPAFQLFTRPDMPVDPHLRFPVIVKPNREGSAKGIWASSVVADPVGVSAQVRRVFERYDQPVLVEEFIEGTELSVGILGNAPPRPLPVLEIDFSSCVGSGERFYSWRVKEYQGAAGLHLTPTFWCPARLPEAVAAAVQAVALKAHQVLECRDFSRADVRLGVDGTPYVLEVNPLPGLDPTESNFPQMARAAELEYPALIARLIEAVAARTGASSSVAHQPDDRFASAAMATSWSSKGGAA